jgi:HEAT repeat protein
MVIISAFVTLSSTRAESPSADDEQTLLRAGLSSDGPSLLAFFHARARTEVDRDRLRELLRQFRDGSKQERHAATMELLGLGPLALPLLRQSAKDLDHPYLAARASRCLPWLEGPSSSQLLMAAARTIAQRKPEGTAAALLAYLPFAVDAEVIAVVNVALRAVAAPDGKPDPALLRGLEDPSAVRRAAAGVALCRAMPSDRVPAVRKLLKDSAAGVRLRAALALAEAHDAEAIPVLIDLLAELNAEQRAPVEDFLTQLAGEWAPLVNSPSDDKIARKIRRDAWAAWWRNTDGKALLEALREHTPTDQTRQKVRDLLTRLGSDDFGKRETASHELFALGRIALPQLREVLMDKDAEVVRHAKLLVERIEREPAHHLPLASLRLLGVRKPAGAVEALLAYFPHAEDEARSEEVRKSLTALALRDGKPHPALRQGLADARPKVRAVAAGALIEGGNSQGRAAVRKLLREDEPAIRLRLALALARAGEREGVSVLIDLLPLLSAAECGQAEEALYRLAGETAPEMPSPKQPDDQKKRRETWAAWWKVNAPRVDLRRVPARPLLGYTLICDGDRVLEVDRQGKTRWSIDSLGFPTDAWVLPGNRVLITEWNSSCVTERDEKGNILWKKDGLPQSAVYAQRLPNGNTFIAVKDSMVLEVNRAGKEIYKIDKIPGMQYAYRSRQGTIVCLTQQGQCLTLDTNGKQLRHFPIKYPIVQRGGLDLLPDGRILIASEQAGKVMEYDNQGKLLHEWDVPQATTATGLPNGHLLVSSPNGNRVVELDRAGKVVWEQTNVAAYRARRR